MTPEQEIFKARAQGATVREIAAKFCLAKSTVGDLLSGKTKRLSDKNRKKATKKKPKRQGLIIVWRATDEYIEYLSTIRKTDIPVFFNISALPGGLTEFDTERYLIADPNRVIIWRERWDRKNSRRLSEKREQSLRTALKRHGADWRTEEDVIRQVNYILRGTYKDRFSKKRAQLTAIEKAKERAEIWEKLPPLIKKTTTRERFLETGDLGYRADKILTRKVWAAQNFGFKIDM